MKIQVRKDINTIVLASLAKFLPYWIIYFIISNSFEMSANTLKIISVIGLYGIGSILFYLVARSVEKVEPDKKSLDFKFYLLIFSAQLAFQAVFIIVNLLKESLFPSVSEMNVELNLVYLISTLMIAPILEEIVERKVIGDRIIKHGEGIYIFFSAFLFALPYIVSVGITTFFSTFVLGFLYAILYLKTGKIIIPIIYHILYNFMNGFMILFLMANFDPMAVGLYSLFLIGLGLVGAIFLIKNRNEIKPELRTKESIEVIFSSKIFIVFIIITFVFFVIYRSLNG